MTTPATATPVPPPPSSPLIQLVGAEKVYRTGRLSHTALRGVDLTIHPGEIVSIVGPSGSGKSTILNLITGIDRPTAGTVTVDGQRIDALSEEKLAAWRGRRVGIVFQFFQLLPTLTALENALLPMELAGLFRGADRTGRARRNLELVGLGDHADHLPSELSGGEQQRVAIARALANAPSLLLADEPTGNLDPETAADVFAMLLKLARSAGLALLIATHNNELAARMDLTVRLQNGILVAA